MAPLFQGQTRAWTLQLLGVLWGLRPEQGPGPASLLGLHVGQLHITRHFQFVDGGQVLQTVVILQQVLAIYRHLEAVTFTEDPHLGKGQDIRWTLRKSSDLHANPAPLHPSPALS